jgi:hypothetical protein|tara:strand:+ start:125 stop:271 length:147 start_codon:yes stop_codon:yes gene_type:complete
MCVPGRVAPPLHDFEKLDFRFQGLAGERMVEVDGGIHRSRASAVKGRR